MNRTLRIAGSCAALALLFCSLAMARDLDQDEALRLRQRGVILPLEQLLKQALDRYPGPGCWKPSWRKNMICTFMRSSC